MRFVKLLAHLFIPHETNNQKAKLLHPSSLSLIAVFLIAFQLVLTFGNKTFPRVLGYAANISPQEVIRLTNAQRATGGLAPLTENGTLNGAAIAKGNDMLAKGYWAHFSPDGTSPWSFFLSFGYKYRYAGENLARDFGDAGSAVSAWMASPTHRDNIMNAKYKEIGIGVVEGSLAGVDTTIIVQFFGTPAGSDVIPEVQAEAKPSTPASAKPKATVVPATPTPTATPIPVVAAVTPSPVPLPTPSIASFSFVSPFNSTRNLSMGIVGVLLLVLSIDLIVVRRRRIARIGGRTLAHIAFFGMILAVILILKAGQII
jgi:uncharacterized protein YkwD